MTDSSKGTSTETTTVPEDLVSYFEKMDNDDEDFEDVKTVSFEVNQEMIEQLQKK